ncbi:rhodanese-like domain-containing protein [Rhodoblastus sp.]|uniref:rhodanese-like domain-containing protein n=1 Tax=Rhodoblastus sp. TaxID=1962975 RepID=UPI003F9D00D9
MRKHTAKARRLTSTLSLLAAAASIAPALPPALSSLSPIGAAHAASDVRPSLQTLAQVAARGEDVITPDGLRGLILAGRPTYKLVDLRSPEAFAAGHIRDAVNIPLARLLDEDQVVALRRVPQVIVYADTPSEAGQATVLLRLAGVPSVALAGGLEAWSKGLTKEAAQAQSAAIVRALNSCPDMTPAAMPASAAPPAAPAPAGAAPNAPKGPKNPPINLKGICG